MPGPRGRHRRGARSRGPRHVRGFIEPCLLLLLHVNPSHGYELAQGLAEFGMERIDASLVYRMLRHMERGGLIASQWQTDVGSGPARRVYRLAPVGHATLAAWVAELRETDRVLHHFLGFFDEHMREGDGDFH